MYNVKGRLTVLEEIEIVLMETILENEFVQIGKSKENFRLDFYL